MTESSSAQNHPRPEESDLRIIELLDSDPRMTYTEVAAHMGVSRATAKAMVDRLYKRGARTICYVDEWVRGYTSYVTFCINTDPAGLFEVANGLAAMDEVQSVMLFAGPFDIMAVAVFKGQQEIPRFVSDKLGKLRGIVRRESIVYHEIKPGHPARSKGQGDGADLSTSLDDLDIGLILELEKNARESATALAAKLRTTRTTIVRRMNRLVQERVLTFQTILGNYAQGYRGVAFAGMKVTPSRIRKVGLALAGHARVRSVFLCNGRYDVMAWITYEDQEDLIDFLDGEVGRMPGITGVESGIALSMVKYESGRLQVSSSRS